MATDHTDASASFEESAGQYDDLLLHNIAGAERLIASIPAGDYRDVLDIGCGTGFATFAFARRFRPQRVVGCDPAGAMLDIMRTKLGALEGTAVELHAADVSSLPVADGEFDAVISSMAFHWFPDKAGAVATMAAKLRPGGVLAMLTAGVGADGAFRDVLRAVEPPLPPHLEGTFDFAQRDIPQLEEYLAGAGLEPIDLWTERRVRVADPDAYQARMRAVAGHVMGGMDPEVVADIDARIDRAFRAACGPDGFRYEFVKLFVLARKPV